MEGESDHPGIRDSIPAMATVSGGCLAAIWNTECARKNGQILGEEAANINVDVLLAPAMNIVRSPLCGRNLNIFRGSLFDGGNYQCLLQNDFIH